MVEGTESEPCNLEDMKEMLLEHICTENKAFFKHLQIDDPPLSYNERNQIASELLQNSHFNFLQRFGMNMKLDHLKFFECQLSNDEPDQEEIKDLLKHITWNLNHHGTIIRNRRYAALVKLIKDKNYFSEGEMMSRDPLLFDQLIGQYQSRAEKVARRRPNPVTDTLVDVLLEGIDNDHNTEIEKRQRAEEERMCDNDDEDSQPSEIPVKSSDDEESSEESHTQWGNFEEPECSTSTSSQAPRVKKRPFKAITANERDFLKEEFAGIMYNKFLSGQDSEFFDYATVDTNEEYDETLEADQDCEDKYFDEEDSQSSPPRQAMMDDDEDELETYMKHLENNLKHQQSDNQFEEEFDE